MLNPDYVYTPTGECPKPSCVTCSKCFKREACRVISHHC